MRINLLKKRSLVFLLTMVFLIILHFLNILKPVENILIKYSSPVQKIFYASATYINKLSIFSIPRLDLIKRNQLLEEKNRNLSVENIALKAQIEQTQLLKEHIEYLKSHNNIYVTARITGKDIFQQYNFLNLDKGSKDGIVTGLPVIAEKGILVGKIIEVSENSSKVILLTNAQSQTAATLENKNKTMGVVTGDFSLSMKMELIPQEEQIEINDIIITSGLEEYIPSGLIVGEVTRTEKEPRGFFQTAYLRPLIPYNNIFFVSILKTNEL